MLSSITPVFPAATDEEFKDKIKLSSSHTIQPTTTEQSDVIILHLANLTLLAPDDVRKKSRLSLLPPNLIAIDTPSWIAQISLQKNTPLCADMVAYLADITSIPPTTLKKRYEQALSATSLVQPG